MLPFKHSLNSARTMFFHVPMYCRACLKSSIGRVPSSNSLALNGSMSKTQFGTSMHNCIIHWEGLLPYLQFAAHYALDTRAPNFVLSRTHIANHHLLLRLFLNEPIFSSPASPTTNTTATTTTTSSCFFI